MIKFWSYKIIVLLILINSVFGRNNRGFDQFFDNNINDMGIINFSVRTPSVTHINNTYLQNGFSIDYKYSGFCSDMGQVNIHYTNSNKDAFLIGIGFPYITLGLNKNIGKKRYFNLNIAPYWGAIGFSKLIKEDKTSVTEITSDIHINRGYDADMFGYNAYSRGISSTICHSKKLWEFLYFSGEIGLSFIQFREGFDAGIEENGEWVGVTEKKIEDNKNYKRYDEFRWKSLIAIPFSLSLSIDL